MKKYNYKRIKEEVRRKVQLANSSPDNKYQGTVWGYHILPVTKLSLLLGKRFNADLEVLELSAYLHDYSAILNIKFAKEHHIHSARLAGAILSELDYPEEKIKHIQECILSHRGSKPKERKTVEAKILASADAMSHFTELADMLYLTYGIHKYDTREGAIWFKDKLARSWKKIMPAGRELIRSDHEIAMKILNQAINNIK